jgi:hypothetical protein
MRRVVAVTGGLLVLCGALATHAQTPFDTAKTFSATVEMSGGPPSAGPQGQGRGVMKIYRSGDRIRTDLPGGAGYTIMDVSQHTNYMVMGNGMCMQMTAPPQETPLAHSPDATIERAAAGTDTVDGHVSKVENLTITPHSGPRAGQPSTMKVWEAQDLHGFPIKVETQTSRGPVSMQYKDISLSEPDAALFAHPDNCRSMPAMPGMPGTRGMPGAPPGAGPP